MLGGIALLGTITASVAAWLVQKVAEEDGAGQAATRHQVNELTAQVRALQQLLAARLTADPSLPVRVNNTLPVDLAPAPAGRTVAGPRFGTETRFGTGKNADLRRIG
jgi:hypothetical protein